MMRILVTRPRSQADEFGDALSSAGFEPVFFPVIEIQPADPAPLDAALKDIDHFDWVVFTSVNGVQAVWDRMKALRIPRLPISLKVAAIGPKTAAALLGYGVSPDYVPEEYVAEAIVPGLGNLTGCSVLLPRADLARKALAEKIRAAGATTREVIAYRTVPAGLDPQSLQALQQGIAAVTLASASSARSFAAMVRAAGLDPLCLPGQPVYAYIGPITAEAAREEGLPDGIVAGEYTTEGLVKALQFHLVKKNRRSDR